MKGIRMAPASSMRQRHPMRLFGVVVAAGVLVASGIGYATANEVTDQVKRTEVFGLVKNRPENDGGTNILLVGSDDRTGLSKAERSKLHVGQSEYGSHTDSMMIAHLADDGSVGIVSIPRDSYVEIPAHTTSSGKTIPSSKQKINAAFSIGGPSLAVETVERSTGVHIDHYAEVNFQGFVTMVDGLGGVPMCLKTPIKDQKSGLDLPAGNQMLNGTQGLGFVRARYFDPSADLGRMKRQQTFVGAMFKQAMSPSTILNPARMVAFLNSAAGAVTVDENFSKRDMWNLAAKMRSVNPSNVTFQTIPLGQETSAPGVGSVVVWDQAKSSELFNRLKTGEPLVEKAPEASGPTVEVAPSTISVRILNGSTVSGQGTKAIKEFKAAGYRVSGIAANAPKRTGEETVIEYDPRYDNSLKTLQEALPGATVKPVKNLGRTFRITVGSGYDGVKAVKVSGPAADQAAAATKPKTAADDPCA